MMSALYKLGLQLASWKQTFGYQAYPIWGLSVAFHVCFGPLLYAYLLSFYSGSTPTQVLSSSEAPSIMATSSNSIDVAISRGIKCGYWSVLVSLYRDAAQGLILSDPKYQFPKPDTTAAILASLPILIPQSYYDHAWREHRFLYFLSTFIWYYGAEYLYPQVSRVLKPCVNQTGVRWIYVALRLLSGQISAVQAVQAIQDYLMYI